MHEERQFDYSGINVILAYGNTISTHFHIWVHESSGLARLYSLLPLFRGSKFARKRRLKMCKLASHMTLNWSLMFPWQQMLSPDESLISTPCPVPATSWGRAVPNKIRGWDHLLDETGLSAPVIIALNHMRLIHKWDGVWCPISMYIDY